MADLLVRGVDDALVRELKKRAGANGRSAEAEHRAILAAALLTPPRLSLAELLAGMPDVGLDSDFQRVGDGEIPARLVMIWIDTNVISEARKGQRADPGVIAFWAEASVAQAPLFLPAVVVGDLRRGVDLIRHRGDLLQAQRLERWLAEVLELYGDRVLALDQQIAAIALLHDLTLVTRNTRDFVATGVRLRNPFVA